MNIIEFTFYYNSILKACNNKRIQSSKYFECTNVLIYIVFYHAAMLSNKRSLAHRYQRSLSFFFLLALLHIPGGSRVEPRIYFPVNYTLLLIPFRSRLKYQLN